MRRLPLCRVLFVAGILLLFPIASIRADIGRKPAMEFTFEYEIEPVEIISGQLIECEDEACETGEPLESVGPQHFTCSASSCSSMAYSYADYHKLVIEFADRVRESNVFTKRAFDARYRVIVSQSALVVEGVGGGIGLRCCSGLLGTLAIETLVAIAYLGLFRLPRALLGWVPLASLLSLPVVWFGFPQLALPAGWVVGLSETFAVLFEAEFLYLATRGKMSLPHVAALSLAMNGVSFAVGLSLRV